MKQLLIALVLIFGSLTLINASAKTSDYVDPVNFKNVVAAWDISVTELTDQVPENHAFELGCGKGGTSCGLFTCCEANALLVVVSLLTPAAEPGSVAHNKFEY